MKIEFKDYRIGFLTGLFEVSADTIPAVCKEGSSGAEEERVQ